MKTNLRSRWNVERLESRTLLAVDLAVMVSDGDVTAQPGDTIVYHLEYANRGETDATGVMLGEFIFPRAAFNADASSPGWNCGGMLGPILAHCRLEIGDLAAGAAGAATFAVTVPNDAALAQYVIWNIARIRDDGTHGLDANRRNNHDVEQTPIGRPAAAVDLKINLSDGDATAHPGGSLAYTVEYANMGTAGATGVVIRQSLSPLTTFDAEHSSDGWHCFGGITDPRVNSLAPTCTLEVGELAAGGMGTATLAVTVAAELPATLSQLVSSAAITDDHTHGFDPTPHNNFDTEATPIDRPPVAAPDLTLTKDDGVDAVAPGGTITYSLGYANVGVGEATGVLLTEFVPAYTRFVAEGSTDGWRCDLATTNLAGSICILPLATLAPGDHGTATFIVRVAEAAPLYVTGIRNSARIRDDGRHGLDPTPHNNLATAITPIERPTAPAPSAAVEKVVLTASRKPRR